MSRQKTAHRIRRASQIGVNYIGGLGYYALLFGWAIVAILLLLRVSQYILRSGYVPTIERFSVLDDPVTTSGSFSWELLVSIPLIIGLFVIVVLFPYFIGRYMNKIVRWCIDATSLQTRPASLLIVKIWGIGTLLGTTILGIFGFYQPSITNIPSYLIFACAVLSLLLFLLQHLIARIAAFTYDEIV